MEHTQVWNRTEWKIILANILFLKFVSRKWEFFYNVIDSYWTLPIQNPQCFTEEIFIWDTTGDPNNTSITNQLDLILKSQTTRER